MDLVDVNGVYAPKSLARERSSSKSYAFPMYKGFGLLLNNKAPNGYDKKNRGKILK